MQLYFSLNANNYLIHALFMDYFTFVTHKWAREIQIKRTQKYRESTPDRYFVWNLEHASIFVDIRSSESLYFNV